MDFATLVNLFGGIGALVVLAVAYFVGTATQQMLKTANDQAAQAAKLEAEVHASSLKIEELQQETEQKYLDDADRDLRAKRMKHYPTFWRLTDRVPMWPRKVLTGDDLHAFLNTLRSWYYERGGLYMSEATRKAFGKVQDAIRNAFEELPETGEVDPDTYDTIRDALSAMRTEMTRDLGTRRGLPDRRA